MTATTHVDPVCGMTVDPATARGGSFAHEGTTYYFCGPGCRQKFAADPAAFLGPGRGRRPMATEARTDRPRPAATGTNQAAYVCPMDPDVRQPAPGDCPKCGMALETEMPAAPATRIEWTCPMHPEVVRSEPGSCPICGMALEPRNVTADEPVNHELGDMSRRLWISAAFAVPLVAISMGDALAGGPIAAAMGPQRKMWLEFLLATPICLRAAWPLYQRAWRSIATWNLNMFTLIGLGVSTAYGYSVVGLVAAGGGAG
jgi:Cu+-exporting ATPase